MKKYTQITLSQRYTISSLHQQGVSQKRISEAVDLSPSTISRELRRNRAASGKYCPTSAQKKASVRHQKKAKHIVFTDSMKAEISSLLQEDFSPEQVRGHLHTQGKSCVSVESIYQHIWQDKKTGGDLYTHLRTKGKRYRKRGALKDSRGLITNRVSIEQRPDIVDKKKRIGDLEIDTIIGKDHKGAIVTINDRVTGMLKMRKVASKQADLVEQAAVELLQEWKPWLKTITSDNGKEFARHAHIAKQLEVDFYFAQPYHSWQRGANENLNGLIRQYIPKKTDFSTISEERVLEIEQQLNDRPRKRLNFMSPNQALAQKLEENKITLIG